MRIQFSKESDTKHRVTVLRADGSEESKSLNSRSFLFHDIAHFVIESEVPLKAGFWGSVANGESLSASELSGSDVMQAEALAGPIQSLAKADAEIPAYLAVLERVIPENPRLGDLAVSIHKRVRELKGLWRATNYGKSMEVEWPD